MTKKDLINLVAQKAHLTKRASKEAVETFLGEIIRAMKKGEKVVISGFGTFKVKAVRDKTVIVPRTKDKKVVKAHRAPRFVPGKPLKMSIK